ERRSRGGGEQGPPRDGRRYLHGRPRRPVARLRTDSDQVPEAQTLEAATRADTGRPGPPRGLRAVAARRCEEAGPASASRAVADDHAIPMVRRPSAGACLAATRQPALLQPAHRAAPPSPL